MTSDEIRKRIDNEVDYVNIKRFNYSLTRLLERYPEGAPTNVICQALNMTEEELEYLFQNILTKLRKVIR